LSKEITSRRDFLKLAGTAAWAAAVPVVARPGPQQPAAGAPNYVLRIAASPIEIAPKHIVSTITYNGQFPGPLLRFKEGRPATIEIHNDTDTPEQLHWHGQMVSTDVDGAAEEGTPFIPARGMRRIVFTPRPSGFRFYHTHIAREAICTPANTAAKSVRFTSSQRMSRAATTGKFFWCSKNSNRLSLKAVTWRRMFWRPAQK